MYSMNITAVSAYIRYHQVLIPNKLKTKLNQILPQASSFTQFLNAGFSTVMQFCPFGPASCITDDSVLAMIPATHLHISE